jgi:hypothetical protein
MPQAQTDPLIAMEEGHENGYKECKKPIQVRFSYNSGQVLYFPAQKTHSDFFVRNFRKKNDECILILVIYWKKTGLLHTKISNHNIIYSS